MAGLFFGGTRFLDQAGGSTTPWDIAQAHWNSPSRPSIRTHGDGWTRWTLKASYVPV